MKKNSRYQILTSDGFKYFSGIIKKKKQSILLKLSNGKQLKTSLDHIIIFNNMQMKVTELKINDEITKDVFITDIQLSDIIDLYDPVDVKDTHSYYGDGINHHNCSFIGSSFCLFNADTLSRLSHKQFIYSKDNLDILEEPKRGDLDETGKQISPDHAYVLVADTSRGVGGDYSAFVVVDITELPYTVVAKFRDNNITPLLYPSIIHTVAKNYNNAYILVEVNDNGQQIADILYNDLEYENMIWINREGVRGQVASTGFKGGTKQCGVRTDKKVKRIGCTHLKTLVEGQKLLVWDSDIISEFSTFIEHKDSYAADEGYHDDLVMPLVLFGWLTTNPFFSDLTNINIREKMYDMQIKQIEDELTPFGFIDYGITDEEKKYFIQDGDLWSISTERDPSILS